MKLKRISEKVAQIQLAKGAQNIIKRPNLRCGWYYIAS